MLVPACDFLIHGIRDITVARTSAVLQALPTPDYVLTLEQQLQENGIDYLHIGYRIENKKIEVGYESRRVYRVKSFVWHGSLFIIRDRFNGDNFQEWSPQLRDVWSCTMVDVPDTKQYC